jgi:hypothetical protein
MQVVRIAAQAVHWHSCYLLGGHGHLLCLHRIYHIHLVVLNHVSTLCHHANSQHHRLNLSNIAWPDQPGHNSQNIFKIRTPNSNWHSLSQPGGPLSTYDLFLAYKDPHNEGEVL